MIGEREEEGSTPRSRTSGEPLAIADGDHAFGGSGDDGDEEEFEFAFVIKGPEAWPEITADELFSNGQIRTIYPVFGSGLLLEPPPEAATKERTTGTKARGTLRRFFIEEREEDSGRASSTSSSSSSAGVDELDGIPEGTYCVWAPAASPSQSSGGKKSGSTGSSLRWRLQELVTGRSHSEGREKIVLLAAAAVAEEVTEGEEEKRREGRDEMKERNRHCWSLGSVPAGGRPRRCPM